MTNEQLVLRIRAGVEEADNMAVLYEQMKGLIGKIAGDFKRSGETEDLKQEGYFGLCDAVRCYRPETGVPFHLYARFWIRQAMGRYLEECGSLIRIPANQRAGLLKLRNFCGAYYRENGEKPDETICMDYLGLSVKQIRELERLNQIDTPGSPDKETEEWGKSAQESPLNDVLENMYKEQLKRALWAAVDTLEAGCREALVGRYAEELTFREIGNRMGISVPAARQWEKKALKAMRTPDKKAIYAPYMDDGIYDMGRKGTGKTTFFHTWTSATERTAMKYAEK